MSALPATQPIAPKRGTAPTSRVVLETARAVFVDCIAEIDAKLAALDGAQDPAPQRDDMAAFARVAGYTGDACTHCQSFTLKRSGACAVCETCGTTTGCS